MRTSLECLPCMMRQALRVLHLAVPDTLPADAEAPDTSGQPAAPLRAEGPCTPCTEAERTGTGAAAASPCTASTARAAHARREAIAKRFMERVSRLDFAESPPGVLRHLYGMVREETGVADPYAVEKAAANARALELLPGLRERVRKAEDPLLTALHLSVIGNYLDAGTGIEFDWEGALEREQSRDLAAGGTYARFSQKVRQGAGVVVVGDNCGEIALDTLLVSELLRKGCNVTYAVRDVPVLNDATLEDADTVGMTALCRVVSSGCDAPGTVADRCSPAFLTLLARADVVLAKGQGNYEGMNTTHPDAFYAFKAKCPVIARELSVPQGTTMFRNA